MLGNMLLHDDYWAMEIVVKIYDMTHLALNIGHDFAIAIHISSHFLRSNSFER